MLRLDMRGIKRTEIWGIVIITCFNLALLTVAIRFGGLSPTLILLLVAVAQACSVVVIRMLLKVRLDQDYLDAMSKASDKTIEILTSKGVPTAESIRALREAAELLTKTIEELPCQKNLPPS